MSKNIVLVSCVLRKKSGKHKARDLYDSSLFRYSLKYAQKLKPDRIYIISAKYGLLPLDKQVTKYNQTLIHASREERIEWGKGVVAQMRRGGVDPENDKFIVLASSAYVEGLCPWLKHMRMPMDGLGIGARLKFLKDRVGKLA